MQVFSSVCVILSGGNRRSQGRRGASVTRGSRTRPGGSSVKFEGEFDFESSNAKFNKEEIEEELQQKLHDNLRITNEVNINFGLNDCRLMSMDIYVSYLNSNTSEHLVFEFVLIIVFHSLTLVVGWPRHSHKYRQLYFSDASM